MVMIVNLAQSDAASNVVGPPQVSPLPHGQEWVSYMLAVILIIAVTLASMMDPKRRTKT